MSTLVEVFNRTLEAVGINDPLTTDSDDVPRADTLNLHYPAARQTFLRSYDWSWARSSLNPAVLTVPQPDPIPLSYSYQYDLPADMLKFRYILPEKDDIVVERYTDGTTKFLLTNYGSVIEIVYTYDVAITLWPEEAIDTFVFFLATRVEVGLADSDTYFERNELRLLRSLNTAWGGSRLTEQQPSKKRVTSLADARKGIGV